VAWLDLGGWSVGRRYRLDNAAAAAAAEAPHRSIVRSGGAVLEAAV